MTEGTVGGQSYQWVQESAVGCDLDITAGSGCGRSGDGFFIGMLHYLHCATFYSMVQ